MNAFQTGLKLVLTDRELRPYIWRPIFSTLPLLLGLVVLTFFAAGWLASLWVAGPLGGVLGVAITVGIWWFALGPVFFTLAILLSANHWEKLSLRAEQEYRNGPVPNNTTTWKGAMKDTARRFPRSILTTALCMVTGPIFFGAVSAGIAGLQARYDFTAPAFARRGIGWPEQKRLFKRIPGQAPFWLVCALGSWIPIVNLFMLPVLVAAGTVFVANRYPDEASVRALGQ